MKKYGTVLVVLLAFGVLIGYVGKGYAAERFSKSHVSDKECSEVNFPQDFTSFTEEEYQKLSDLQLEGYQEMSVSDYQEKIWTWTDTAEYQNLLERFSQSKTFYACRDQNDLASFFFFVLEPLTAERWQKREFSDAVSTEYSGAAENATLEFCMTFTIEDADHLTVGEYQTARVGMITGLKQILQEKTKTQLQDTIWMKETIDAEINRLKQQWSKEGLQITVEYSYLPLSILDSEFSQGSLQQEQKKQQEKESQEREEQEQRRFSNGTAEDYRALLALKTPDYQTRSIADFNMSLLEWANEDQERMERISCDMLYQDFAVPLTEEERFFVNVSVNFSGMENGKQVQSNYTGKAEEDPSYSQSLPEKIETNGNGVAWCDLYYSFSYHIADKKILTVGERDRCISGMIQGVQKFWEETDLDSLLNMKKAEVAEKLKQIAASYSTDQITITVKEDGISLERIDERGEPTVEASQLSFHSYEKLAAYRTEDYKQKSIAEFHTLLGSDPDTFLELLEAYSNLGTLSPEDENYEFFTVTVNALLNELYCELFEETPTFFIYLSKEERPFEEQNDGMTTYRFCFSAQVNLCYEILSPETLTIRERDEILLTFQKELQQYLDELSEEEIMEGSIKTLLMEKCNELTKQVDSKKMKVSCEIGFMELGAY